MLFLLRSNPIASNLKAFLSFNSLMMIE